MFYSCIPLLTYRYSFQCQIDGSAPIQITWFKDGIPITSPDYEQRFENSSASLTIEETFSEDTAVYTVQAANQHGAVTSSARLVVKGSTTRISLVFRRKCIHSYT